MGSITAPVAVSQEIVRAARAGKTHGERFSIRGYPLVGAYLGNGQPIIPLLVAPLLVGIGSTTNVFSKKDGQRFEAHLPSMNGVGITAAALGIGVLAGFGSRSRAGSIAAQHLASQEEAVNLGVKYAEQGVITGIRHTERDGWSVVAIPQRFRGHGDSRHGTQALDWDTLVSPWLHRTYRENAANQLLGSSRAPFTSMVGPFGTFKATVTHQIPGPQTQRFTSSGIAGDLNSTFETPHGYTTSYIDY